MAVSSAIWLCHKPPWKWEESDADGGADDNKDVGFRWISLAVPRMSYKCQGNQWK